MYDEHNFLTMYNQNLFEEFASKRGIIPEVCFNLEDEEYPEISNQITLRGWKRLASPRTKVKTLIIQEFYANAARTKEDIDEAGRHPFKSYVRGVEVDFSPANIKKVMRIRDNTPGAEIDYETCQHSNRQLDEVLRDLCVEGAA
ncbi:hypothetical protein PIB30_107768 [Stylosanthes scabra]|uniref:Putative plant transposon protein domain-containing protein n=1 Tax=Stylosanthes scabra TaxID=79078 RepID=A0ABU6QYM9_9FABA|nr:hypothetical protein [Stylosanthes scabra]